MASFISGIDQNCTDASLENTIKILANNVENKDISIDYVSILMSLTANAPVSPLFNRKIP